MKSISIHRGNSAPEIQAWSSFLKQIRAFFEERGFCEISTDSLVPVGAFESQIDALTAHAPQSGLSFDLHTSPEFEMKRVLGAARIPIYQICKCFRDDPTTSCHRREFTMLEFYRPGVDYRSTRREMRELVEAIAGQRLEWDEIRMRDLFRRHLDLDLEAALTAPSLRCEIEARQLIALSADDTWEDMFFKLMIERVEPALTWARPTLVYDYPPALCALAEKDPLSGWAQRFEIYWKGMELCNGCTELADPDELRRRFETETRARIERGKKPHPFPQALAQAIETSPAPSSGVAVGLDRLFACVQSQTEGIRAHR